MQLYGYFVVAFQLITSWNNGAACRCVRAAARDVAITRIRAMLKHNIAQETHISTNHNQHVQQSALSLLK